MTLLTVADLSRAKRLPADYLRTLGLADTPAGVEVPYYDPAGSTDLGPKLRTHTSARQGSRWPKGQRLEAYGQWRLGMAHHAGYLLLVEGESDCWACWRHGVPALGVPGAGAVKGTLRAEYLEGLETIYVHQEPDPAGALFVRDVAAQLGTLGFAGRAWLLRLPAGTKDLADLHAADPGHFVTRVEAAREAAVLLPGFDRPATNGHANGAAHATGQRPVAAAAAEPEPVVRCVTAIQSQPVRWLWEPWLPLDALSILDGDPGLGKSTLTMDLAARVSRGWPMPPELGEGPGRAREPGGVLILSAEDSPERTIRPRLVAAGADTDRCHLFEAVRLGEDERPPVLPSDLDLVSERIQALGVILVIVDPFMAYLDSGVDSHSDQDVRRALHRLKLLAEKTGVCILLVRHLNKLTGGSALYRGGGSIGIIGSARSALVVGRDPGDDDRRVLAGNKVNWGPLPRSLTYRTEVRGGVVYICWGEECDLSADDVLGAPRRQSMGGQCAAVIRDLLTHPMTVAEFEAALTANGFGERAIRDGRRAAGVIAHRVSGIGGDGAWMVRLPDTTQTLESIPP